ncbi:MAG: efflux RND transporter periplasmic adaptor subunit [Cystobacter sp.]
MAVRVGWLLLAALLSLSTAGCSKQAPSPVSEKEAVKETQKAEVKLCPHGVPAELCTRCEPDLIPVFQAQGDWCEEHGVPESQCFQCNPKLTFSARAPAGWCAEHGVPESKCTQCNPKLVATFIAAGDYCREHGFPLSVCPIHHPEVAEAAGQPPPSLVQPTTRVRLASADTEKDVGIRTQRVAAKPLARGLDVVGQLDFNQNRLARLSARGEALVQEVKVDVGDTVKAGQPLVALASASVGEGQAQRSAARARVSAARANVERERLLVAKGISSRQSLEVAEAELAAAQASHEAASASLGAAGASVSGSGGRYVLTAPFTGTVVARHVTVGGGVAPGEVLLEVADLSTFWARLDIPEADAALVRPGQKVTLLFEGTRDQRREATLSRVDSRVDAATRTVHARVELPNPDGTLKAGVFLRAKVELAPEHEALLVPQDAIQYAQGRTLVFVREAAGLFQPLLVELGARVGDEVEVVKGLSPGAEVVTTGAFLLKTEILKDSIGAGCCEEGGE